MYQNGILIREPGFEYLGQHLHFIIHLDLIHATWGSKIDPQRLHFIFPFIFRLMGLRGCGIYPLQPHLLFSFQFFQFLSFGRGGVGSNPHSPTLISSP